MFSITIYDNNVAVLYNKYMPIGACAGDIRAIDKFINWCLNEYGSTKLFGEHLLIAMRQKEERDNGEE